MIRERLVVDLHLHSRFSMGTSPSLDLASLAASARSKGIDILAAPDYTHPEWFAELCGHLNEVTPGTYEAHGARFILVTEVSCVFQQDGKGRRIHLLVAAPSLEAAGVLSARLGRYQDLMSDARPTLGLSVREVAEIAWSISEWFEVIPAHVWTPWYGLLGSRSGFNSLEECFGEDASRIHAIETGLSSDPAMNWNVPAVGDRAIISFSDAHSAGTMGREVTVLDAEPAYEDVISAVRENRVLETIEFHPEHGKYHLDGHRKCGVRMTPEESAKLDGRCSTCGRKMTLGVLNRVTKLSDGRVDARLDPDGLNRSEVGRPPYRSLVPLREVISFALEVGPSSKKVQRAQDHLVGSLGGELAILSSVPVEEIARVAGERVALAILAIRQGNVEREPGFDGQYGIVRPVIQGRVI